jgi:hypothetical protein
VPAICQRTPAKMTYALFIGGLKDQTDNWHRLFTRATPQLLRSGTDARDAELGGEDHGGTADARRGPGAVRFAAGWPHRSRQSLRPYAPTDYPQPVTRQSQSAAWQAVRPLRAFRALWECGALTCACSAVVTRRARRGATAAGHQVGVADAHLGSPGRARYCEKRSTWLTTIGHIRFHRGSTREQRHLGHSSEGEPSRRFPGATRTGHSELAPPAHPLTLVLPTLLAHANLQVRGSGAVDVVPAGNRKGGLQSRRPLRVSLDEPQTWLEVRPRSPSTCRNG